MPVFGSKANWTDLYYWSNWGRGVPDTVLYPETQGTFAVASSFGSNHAHKPQISSQPALIRQRQAKEGPQRKHPTNWKTPH